MVEFVLVLPLLAVILGLTFFFGWATMHKHQVVVADRYAAWRRIETGSWPAEAELNDIAFMGKAADVNLAGSQDGLKETAQDLQGAAGRQHERAGDLAEELVVQRFPAGQEAHVSARFDPQQALWAKFTGYIHHAHGREGVSWRRDHVNCWDVLRDQFYPEFDEELGRLPPPASGMAGTIRHLYLANWPAHPGTLD